jgi:hypothetical protein
MNELTGRTLIGFRADVRHRASMEVLVCEDTLGRPAMPSDKKLDPTGERAEATEAMESTPISGKDHEYRADGDHCPSQHGTAPEAGVQTERHISEGIPGAGRSPETAAERERGPRP